MNVFSGISIFFVFTLLHLLVDSVTGLQFSSIQQKFRLNKKLELACISGSGTNVSSQPIISKMHSNQKLQTGGNSSYQTYQTEQLQCGDMGRYLCSNNGSSETEFIDVKLRQCAPKLCPGEKQPKTIYPELDNITVSFCVMAPTKLKLEQVFWGTKLDKKRYKGRILKQSGQELYYNVSIDLLNMSGSDVGMLTFRLKYKQRRGHRRKQGGETKSSRHKKLDYTIKLILLKEGLNFIGLASSLGRKKKLKLICESRDHPPHMLTIARGNRDQELQTRVVGQAKIYKIKRVQCEDMDVYTCTVNNDTIQTQSIDVTVKKCAPEPCFDGLNETKVYVQENSTVNVPLCIIGRKSLTLENISIGDDQNSVLPKHRYDFKITRRRNQKPRYNVNIKLYRVQRRDFGLMTVYLTHMRGRGQPMKYKILLEEIGFDFKAEGPYSSTFNISESLTLKCKTEGLPSSSLSIVKKDNNQPLHTEVINGSLVYTIESVHCQDMGTYLCLYTDDTSQNVTLYVPTCFTFKASSRLGTTFSYGYPLDIICESPEYPAESLSIVMKDRNKTLLTEVINGTRVYHVNSLQCDDMGTYGCLFGEDPTQNTSLLLPIQNCAPQLCPDEDTRTVDAEVNCDLNIYVCIIAHDNFFLDRIFLDGKESKIIEKNRYKPYSSSEMTGEDQPLYHSVDLEMYNITVEDFGRVTFRLRHVSVVGLLLDYEINLQQTTEEDLNGTDEKAAMESAASHVTRKSPDSHGLDMTTEGDSFIIYVISGVCTFVALVLVGIFIYCQIRVKNYRNNGNYTATTNTDVHCVLLNYLPKHGLGDSTGGLKHITDDLLCTSTSYKRNANDDDDADDDDEYNREVKGELEDELQSPGYHIYEAID